jgi:hypothetical protein
LYGSLFQRTWSICFLNLVHLHTQWMESTPSAMAAPPLSFTPQPTDGTRQLKQSPFGLRNGPFHATVPVIHDGLYNIYICTYCI